MPRFTYVATAVDGSEVTGSGRFDNEEAAHLALYEQELRGIRVTEKQSLLQKEVSAPRVKREEVMHLSRQLGAFVRAGIPVLDAVQVLGEEAPNSSMKRMLSDIEDGLRAGDTFSDCVDRHPKIFPDFYRGILRSAELTGELDTVLDQLSDYLERDLEARRKIKAAMIYPSIVAVMSFATVAILAVFVLPKFKDFFASLDAELPLPTRMLLATTDFLTQFWWMLLVATAAATILGLLFLRTGVGRLTRDKLLLRLPVVGDAIKHALIERFCRILASMVGAGVTLPQALTTATDSLRNRVYVRGLAHVHERMLEGEGIAGPLGASGLFPATAVRMIRVGEDTGTLDTQLGVTAAYYERELDYKLKRVTALIEPAVIVLMGLLVGFVAVALVSAMYGIFNQVQV